jgi:amidase
MANAAAMGGLATAACQPTPPAPASDALGDLDGVGIAAAIRAGDITAQEALDAAIARAERVNGELNFIASPTYDFARQRVAGELSGPFAGVPTLIKDLMPVTGLPTHYGSRAFANNVADAQPPFMDALLAAGLVPFGKSTTPEFGLTATTEPLLGGPTKNPWDTSRSCGGSSGGAAVAVAARVIPVAHASDGGGSIRIPASCNGVFGLKPSRNRTLVARDDEGPLPISVNGCVSRSVRDTAVWLSVVEQTGDGAALPPVGLVEGANTQRLRIAVQIPDYRGQEPDPEVRAAIEAAAQLCRSLGHDIREGFPQFDGEAFSRDFTLLWASMAAGVVQQVQANAGQTPLDQLFEPLTLDLARHYQDHGPAALAVGVRRLREVEARYAAFFADVDILLTPVLAKPPPLLGEISPTLGMAEGFARVTNYVAYTPLQNVAGAPAMSVPLAWSQSGLPIGAHFSAAPGQERKLLELAYALEQAQPWSTRAPGVRAA